MLRRTRQKFHKVNNRKWPRFAAAVRRLDVATTCPASCLPGGLCPWMRVGLGCDEKNFPGPRKRAEMTKEPRGTDEQDQRAR
jgi:hypothetical protein